MKLKVLHCIYDDPDNPWVAGGGAVRVRELYRRLQDEVSCTVATGGYEGAEDGAIDGIQYRRLGASKPYALSRWTYSRAATSLLAHGDYDVAVFDYSVYTPIQLPRNRSVGVTVHHVTGGSARERWGRLLGGAVALAERRTLQRARWLSATSGATAADLRKIVDPRATVLRVEAGVPDELFELRHAEAGDYLLYFGRLDWFQKGLDTLLDGFAKLARQRPILELRIAGRGKDLERVRSRAADLGLSDRIRLLGAVSDEQRNSLFSSAKLLLMPSRFEGFGMVAAEAMAAGVPVVAAAGGSLPEVVSAPEGGLLFPVGDADAMAATAGSLLDDDQRRLALSRSARVSAERFRWDAVAHDHLEFLKTIQRDFSDSNIREP